jgi:hypothetical protein
MRIPYTVFSEKDTIAFGAKVIAKGVSVMVAVVVVVAM